MKSLEFLSSQIAIRFLGKKRFAEMNEENMKFTCFGTFPFFLGSISWKPRRYSSMLFSEACLLLIRNTETLTRLILISVLYPFTN